MIRMTLFIAAATVLIGTAAQAQQRPNPDSNGDGLVSRAEADAMAGQMFAMLDRNNDGRLDQADRSGAAMDGASTEGRGAENGGGRGGRMLQMLDTNRDGAISREEFLTGAARRHGRMDTNGDGNVSAAEREAAQAQRGERRSMRRPQQ